VSSDEKMPRRARSSSLEGNTRRLRNRQQVGQIRQRALEQHQPADQLHQYAARRPNADVHLLYTGAMDVICSFCEALRFPNERLNCCHSGKIALPPLQPYPEQLIN